MKLTNRLEAAITKLTMYIGATREYLQLVTQKEIMILSRCNFQKIPALNGLRYLNGINGCKNLRASLSTCCRRRNLATKLPSQGEPKCCTNNTIVHISKFKILI